uniref:Nanos homolog 2 n=1 Tax=Oryzias latipes TaxID=8090 RepID=A0A3P9KV56_ORYLA
MASVQTTVDVQSAHVLSEDCFDMWHDYMNLSALLQRLCNRRQVDPEEPKQEPAAPWRIIQTQSSAETSSVSSLSDSSCGGSPADYCRFCKQNGETRQVYRSHALRSDDRKVICPILRNYTCPICGATGDRAHTRKYCPQAQREDAARMLPAYKFW